uniref:Archaemetzincin n=1 Tax=Fervidicoccus fontis TaxID=683846 RepID=A0A7J3ZL05_9CREN
MEFEVVAFLDPPKRVLVEVASTLQEAFNAKASIAEGARSLPVTLYDPLRGQYNGLLVLEWVCHLRKRSNSVLLAIVNADGYVEGLNFVFGVASHHARAAVVFLERLRREAGASWWSDDLFLSRLKKETVHEVGHVLGLNHCENRRCVMAFSNSILDTDYKEWRFCKRCYTRLAGLGYIVSHSYIFR